MAKYDPISEMRKKEQLAARALRWNVSVEELQDYDEEWRLLSNRYEELLKILGYEIVAIRRRVSVRSLLSRMPDEEHSEALEISNLIAKQFSKEVAEFCDNFSEVMQGNSLSLTAAELLNKFIEIAPEDYVKLFRNETLQDRLDKLQERIFELER